MARERGGNRENAGRKQKWGEPLVKIGVPGSMRNGLLDALESLWEKGYRGEELTQALRSAEFRKVKKFDNTVSAGPHSTASVGGDSMNESYEEIDLAEVLIGNSDETFIIPVAGDSMVGIGIYDGDWVIVDRKNKDNPKKGDIVVVAINDELMVKRFDQEEDGQIVFLSANEKYEPIRHTEGSIFINGIVKYSIRRNIPKTI